MQNQYKAKGIGSQVYQYDSYAVSNISRSKFYDPNSLITGMNPDYIIPIWWKQAVPGDTLKISTSVFSRLTTQLAPFMDNVYMDIHFWCVPNRLVWDHWVNMHGERKNPNDSIDYLVPQVKSNGTGSDLSVGSIFDYFRVPIGVPNLSFNSLIFRAYDLVYNDWYRDENLIDSVDIPTGDSDSISNYTLRKRGKRKDYFTSCLPWPQKGDAVELPLGTSAPVVSNNEVIKLKTTGEDVQAFISSAPYNPVVASAVPNNSGARFGSESGLVTDLSEATSATINSLRQAFSIQKLLENDARGGTRYIEMNLAHFGVRSPDARLQRPEFLGGGTFDLRLNIVPQTSETGESPQGHLASFGVINGQTKTIVTSFTEHCLVFAVASIRADLTYQQGLHREFSRRSRYDYYYPELCNLGEQVVRNKEIYAQGTESDDGIFGYQERWSEMRRSQNAITGALRSQASTSLDVWHLAQKFENLPTLSKQFIEEQVPIDRVISVNATNNTPAFISNFFFDETWIRPMSINSIPSLRSHF